jgi:ketosteroid isomerase-like protein
VPIGVPSAAAATPPTSVEPAPTPPAAVRNDQASIQTTLALYADAYSRLDPNGVTAVFPGVDVSAIRNAFSGLRALHMTIESPQTSVSGDTAVVTCTIQQDFTPRVGREDKQRTPARFELKRTGDRWLIVNRR